MISKRDKALIYHQRIIYVVKNFNLRIRADYWLSSFLEAITKNISIAAKKESRDHYHKALGVDFRKYKQYIVMWWVGLPYDQQYDQQKR